ncbi:MAG TPA: (Fe-S)-binding protein [Syntrophorhabdaceae bacterium]|nr:(Fe-S)-binding protein [Syntrophorhabdaceae bacterium]
MGLEQYRGDLAMCSRCSCCKFIPMQMIDGFEYARQCPSISKYDFHSYSAGGRLNIAAAMLKNGFNYSDRILDIVYNCQLCGGCGSSCNYAMDMEVLEPISEFRIKCVEDGHTHPALEKVIGTLRKQGSTVAPNGKRGDWAAGLNLKDIKNESSDVLYHVGCLTSYDKDMWKIARATSKILQKTGVDFGIAGDAELCCGGRAYQMGYRKDFLNQAELNMKFIKDTGVKTVITSCAEGYQAFKVLYEKYNLRGNLEVFHISEYVDLLLRQGRLNLKNRLDMAVTYHDPCRLGRLGEPWIHWEGKKIPGDRFVFDPPKTYRRGTHGVYEPPRHILNSIPGVRLTEMTRIKEYAWCCGSGGGVDESNPQFAQWTARERIEEAASTGAEAIVTACPRCEKTFDEAIRTTGSRLKVYDVVELLEKAI